MYIIYVVLLNILCRQMFYVCFFLFFFTIETVVSLLY